MLIVEGNVVSDPVMRLGYCETDQNIIPFELLTPFTGIVKPAALLTVSFRAVLPLYFG